MRGEHWWAPETTTTAFVESTVNQVITGRMVERQQASFAGAAAHFHSPEAGQDAWTRVERVPATMGG